MWSRVYVRELTWFGILFAENMRSNQQSDTDATCQRLMNLTGSLRTRVSEQDEIEQTRADDTQKWLENMTRDSQEARVSFTCF